MAPPPRWRASASLLLLLSVARPAAALRRPASQADEPSVGPQSLNRLAATSSDAARERFELQSVREYENSFNITLRRECASARASTSYLAPLIVPELKLAFCYIPKAACSQFKDLFNNLNELHLTEGFGLNYLKSTAKNLNFPKENITKENGWKFAIFTRDPALRYLSAFGSTCVSTSAYGTFEHKWECCGPLIKDNTILPKHMVSMFETRVQFDAKNGFIGGDDHWASQVEIFKQCGWDDFNPAKVDFHGDIGIGKVNQQVRDMLAMVGGTQQKHTDLVDRLFPNETIAGHRSPMRVIPPSIFFNRKSTMEALMALYADDYQLIPEVGRAFSDAQIKKTEKQLQTEWKTIVPGIAAIQIEKNRQAALAREEKAKKALKRDEKAKRQSAELLAAAQKKSKGKDKKRSAAAPPAAQKKDRDKAKQQSAVAPPAAPKEDQDKAKQQSAGGARAAPENATAKNATAKSATAKNATAKNATAAKRQSAGGAHAAPKSATAAQKWSASGAHAAPKNGTAAKKWSAGGAHASSKSAAAAKTWSAGGARAAPKSAAAAEKQGQLQRTGGGASKKK